MMGSFSGSRADSFIVLLGEASKLCPRGEGEWQEMLKRWAPLKDGAAMPGLWERLKTKESMFEQYILYSTKIWYGVLLSWQ